MSQYCYYILQVKKSFKNITKNFSIKDIIASVQIGDILTYSGHTKIIYDLEKDSEGNVIDAITMEVTGGIGLSYVNSKICRHLILRIDIKNIQSSE